MSYNIRIPLNNVLGFSQLMTTDPESMDASQWKEYSKLSRPIPPNSYSWSTTYSTFRDWKRAEPSGRYRSTKSFRCAPDILSMVRMRCEDKIHVDFRTEIESQPFQADIARLTQLILSTLVYSDPCEEKGKYPSFWNVTGQKGLFIFRIVNSPLAAPPCKHKKRKSAIASTS